MRRLRQRKGFTLIELLIVIVIIGILAAIAIPKFSKTRERAFFKAMESDLRNLVTQQELFFSTPKADPADDYQYTDDDEALDFVASRGVDVAITLHTDPALGWSAEATHVGLGGEEGPKCAIFVGEADAVEPATLAGVIACEDLD